MSKILVVEDSIIVNKHITSLLRRNNLESYSAYNAEEALTKIEYSKPDLVLLDIMMEKPDSGLEIAKVINAQKLDLPIIFLTALTDENTLNQIKMVSPYGYLVKPFNEFELLTNIELAIAKSKGNNT